MTDVKGMTIAKVQYSEIEKDKGICRKLLKVNWNFQFGIPFIKGK